MTHKSLAHLATALLFALMWTSCEKAVFSDEEEPSNNKPNKDEITVTFGASELDNAFVNDQLAPQQSRATTPIQNLCNRINLAIYNGDDGTRIKSINQEKGDASFGQIKTTLAKGHYYIAVLAHNGEGNATMTTPSKITFKDNKVTDTFYYYGDIDVGENITFNLTMKRAVAMVRLVMKDKTPANIHNIKFYYTGGSSTFDATTGYGCVNSKQTEIRSVANSAYTGESTYDIYTFPHADGKKLKIEISALENASSTSYTYERTIDNVSVKRNYITRYSGCFYEDESAMGRGFTMSTDDEWHYEDYEY